MTRSRLIALGFGCIVAGALLYAGELALRLLDSDPGLQAIDDAAAAGRPFDARTRSQVVAELRARGLDAVPRIVPARLLEETEDGSFRSRLALDGRELLPLAGIALRTTVLCNETGDWAIYESDRHGFRNPPGSWPDPAAAGGPGDPEIVLVGDSFTLGECVAPGDNIAERLREAHPRTLDLGYSGNSPLFELATLVEYGPVLRPGLVLWIFFENDLAWFDLGQSSRSPLLMRYLEPGFEQGLSTLQPEIDALLEGLLSERYAALPLAPDEGGLVGALSRARAHAGPADFLRLSRLRHRLGSLRHPHHEPREPPNLALFDRTLERAQQVVSGWGGELALVYLPGVWNFDPRASAPSFADPETRGRLARTAASMGIPFIDVHTAFAAHDDPLGLYSYRGESVLGSPHMNARGYALVARTIEGALSP